MKPSLRITILGSGTSTGVPQVGCSCEVCTSTDARDKRLRCSSLFETDTTRVLVDCGPDFREQMLRIPFGKLDAVLVTHEHYDHVGGLDDLRPFCRFGDVDIYAEEYMNRHLRERLPYCFRDQLYPGVPKINLIDTPLHVPFQIGDITITPFRVMHGALPILGYRINDVVYITDMSYLPDSEWAYVKDCDLLLENALRVEPHPSHQSLSEALAFSAKLGNPPTYLIHLAHSMGTHQLRSSLLPPHVKLTYDGLLLTV